MKISVSNVSRSIVSVMFLVISVVCCAGVNAQTTQLGVFNVLPHTFGDEVGDAPHGAMIDYFEKYIIPEMGVAVDWGRLLPFTRMLYQLERGNLHGAPFLIKSTDREVFLYYSEKPVYQAKAVLALRKDHPLNKITSVKDIEDLFIGYGKGIKLVPFLADNSHRLKLHAVDSTDWIRTKLVLLYKGRYDAIYNPDAPPMLFMAKRLNILDKIKILELPGPPDSFYTVFSKNAATGEELVKKFNIALEKAPMKYNVYLDHYNR